MAFSPITTIRAHALARFDATVERLCSYLRIPVISCDAAHHGDVLRLEIDKKRGGGRVWKFTGRATVGGELAAEAEFTAMIDLPK